MEKRTTLHFDRSEKKIHALTVQDVEPILEHNAALRSQPQTRKDGIYHVASVPENVLNKWLYEEIARGNIYASIWDEEFHNGPVRRRLEDPQFQKFRVDK